MMVSCQGPHEYLLRRLHRQEVEAVVLAAVLPQDAADLELPVQALYEHRVARPLAEVPRQVVAEDHRVGAFEPGALELPLRLQVLDLVGYTVKEVGLPPGDHRRDEHASGGTDLGHRLRVGEQQLVQVGGDLSAVQDQRRRLHGAAFHGNIEMRSRRGHLLVQGLVVAAVEREYREQGHGGNGDAQDGEDSADPVPLQVLPRQRYQPHVSRKPPSSCPLFEIRNMRKHPADRYTLLPLDAANKHGDLDVGTFA